MRLTLRTLLAYLDDILEDGDIQTLKAKIEESGLATQLIARIRNSVDHRDIGALSPDAIGPLENANVMGEYLDSTLSSEQIAEIEQLCMESDTSLSEAAACHQILTVVLGEPAQVKDSLRQQIYSLPLSDALRAMEQQTQPAADTSISGKGPIGAESIASLDLGTSVTLGRTEGNGLEFPDDKLVMPDSSATLDFSGVDSFPSVSADAATAVRPVGPDDSGVSQAASKIRSSAGDLDGASEAEIVARTTRAMSERSDVYGGSIRPSRITPLLVTLALAGVMIYVLGQIFAPISGRVGREIGAVTMQDINDDDGEILETLPQSEDTTVDPVTEEAATGEPMDSITPSADNLPDESGLPEESTIPNESMGPNEDMNPKESMGDSTPAAIAESPMSESPMSESTDDASTDALPGLSDPTEASGVTEEIDTTDMAAMKSEDSASPTTDPVMETPDSEKVATMEDPSMINPLIESEEANVPVAPSVDTNVVAKLAGAGSLVLVQGVNGWSRLVDQQPDPATDPKNKANAATTKVMSGQNIIAPALYRPILASEGGLEWALAGPTRIRLFQDDVDAAGAEVISTELIEGRLLLASTQPAVTAQLILGPRTVKIFMPDAQTELAIEMIHFRPAGVDPLVPENRRPIYRIIATQNGATIQSEMTNATGEVDTEKSVTLKTREQWQGRGDQAAVISTVDMLPEWVDDAAQRNLPIESARKGLLNFIDPTKPIEKSLREAMAFRRIEVAALAAETLLLLGRADVYFGSDGILSRPRQRLFWTEHFQMLRQHIASDAKAAASVQTAVARAELADSDNLFRLLVGFSEDELANGGDKQLVEFLDSASMPVRVLAIENLKAIVGDDLGYRADQENANSRRADIKKWNARLRRGDIRYKP